MGRYTLTVVWERGEQPFLDSRYSRAHVWRFDGGMELTASSSPQIVPIPLSDPAAVDPEEAFVASLSSCHMLWFLAIAARRGFCVDRYLDRPEGVLERDSAGKAAFSRVTLRPEVRFSGKVPSPEALAEMHEDAHEECFIARSVRCEVRCEPTDDEGP